MPTHTPVKVEQALPALGFEVFNILCLVQDEVSPGLASEGLVILQHQLVGRDTDVKRVRFGPSL